MPLGVSGFINAGFELRKQIDDGNIPEPDLINLAIGTMGTAVGLILRLKMEDSYELFKKR